MSQTPGRRPDPDPPAQPAEQPLQVQSRPADPERGFRGIMSATLILEVIALLLSIPVARNEGASGVGVVLVCLLVVTHLALCVFVRRAWFLVAVFVLQALIVIGWVIAAPLGILGIVFTIAWGLLVWMRTEYRRRLAAGTLPVPPPAGR